MNTEWKYIIECPICDTKSGIVVLDDEDELPNYCPMCGEYVEKEYDKIE